jgi:gamma-glutamyltranspeptidase / glutathione hydrolase
MAEASQTATAESHVPFSFQFPYRSQRMPVLANQVVATSQPLAAQAGLQMLALGGSAVDAAIAAAATLTVVEPTSNGLGSDAFAIVWDGETLQGLNASGRAPAAWSRAYFDERYGVRSPMPKRGIDTVTIPGCVSAWQALHGRYGRLPFADVLAPSIRYARAGHLVSPITAASWTVQARNIQEPGLQRDFTVDGAAPPAGSRWRFEDQARTLEQIAKDGGQSFYRGDLAKLFVDHAQSLGGAHTLDDFAGHRADWVKPISIDYRRFRLHEIPPNGQGIAALMCLGILRHFDLAAIPVDSVASLHLQIEAMKLAFADVYAQVGDAGVDTARLLHPDYLARRASRIDLNRATAPTTGFPREGGTIYLTAADANGMMVSFIQSNYMGFGSGVVVPSTGVSLQNRGHGFVREPGHPNEVAGGKRPFHTIIPGFLTDLNDQPIMSFGVMGGHMQPQGHVQMVTRIADYGQNPQTASDAPRWLVNPDGTLSLEAGIDPQVVAGLRALGHRLAEAEGTNFAYGGAQLIWRLPDGGYLAASDHRKDGLAVGF